MRLNRDGYVELIDGNLAWLARQPDTLERSHIERIVIWSVGLMYEPPPPSAEHDWRKSHGPHRERCYRCLHTRDLASPYWEYFDTLGSSHGFSGTQCVPLSARPKEEPQP